MRLTRVYVEDPLVVGTRCTLAGSAANHVARVLRLREGDALTLFDGRGGEYSARIVGFRKDVVEAEVLEHRAVERESSLHLTLVQGVSRGERMDWVIQKATELGVRRIVPVLTERTVVRLDDLQRKKKLQHWRGIVIAACEQCGRNRLPELDPPLSLHEALRAVGSEGTRVLLSPEGTRNVRNLERTTSIALLIGPEGGLAEREQEAAVRAGFEPVQLGPRILRTETAAIAALAALQHALGDM